MSDNDHKTVLESYQYLYGKVDLPPEAAAILAVGEALAWRLDKLIEAKEARKPLIRHMATRYCSYMPGDGSPSKPGLMTSCGAMIYENIEQHCTTNRDLVTCPDCREKM